MQFEFKSYKIFECIDKALKKTFRFIESLKIFELNENL